MKAKIWKSLIGVCFVLVVLWMLDEQPAGRSQQEQDIRLASVSVIAVKPEPLAVSVRTTGVTLSRWPVQVLASVSGRITQIAPGTEPGDELAQDTLMVSVQATGYKSEVESAAARVTQAELQLAQNQHEQTVAKRISAGKALTSFGRYEPHIKAAQAELKAAKAALSHAQQLLADTQIKAPFHAVVLDKFVAPGQWINAGESLFKLASAEAVDVKVELSGDQWAQLKGGVNDLDFRVLGPSGQSWPASLRYLSPELDQASRQRSLVIQVENPYSNDSVLLAGEQVMVEFTPQMREDVVTAPASVLTEDGQVWSLKNDHLQLEPVTLVAEQPDQVSFRFVHQPQEPRMLVLYPISTMLAGQEAKAELVSWTPGASL